MLTALSYQLLCVPTKDCLHSILTVSSFIQGLLAQRSLALLVHFLFPPLPDSSPCFYFFISSWFFLESQKWITGLSRCLSTSLLTDRFLCTESLPWLLVLSDVPPSTVRNHLQAMPEAPCKVRINDFILVRHPHPHTIYFLINEIQFIQF